MTRLPIVVSCEHASNRVPPGAELRVSTDALADHFGWDEGAREIALAVGEGLGSPPFLGEWTRLYVDLNRFPERPGAVPAVAFGLRVPGNENLSTDERAQRIERFHRPWRAAVEEAVRETIARHGVCLHLSIHTFTPKLGDSIRDFDMGILFDPDHTLDTVVQSVLLDGLRAAGLDTRPNEPYTGWGDGLTTALRALFGPQAYAGIEVETSHRVVRALGGTRRVVDALVPAAVQAVSSILV